MGLREGGHELASLGSAATWCAAPWGGHAGRDRPSRADLTSDALGYRLGMDDGASEWMIDRLERTQEVLSSQAYSYEDKVESLALGARIIASIFPDERFHMDPFFNEGWLPNARTAIAKALGVVRNQEAIARYLGPAGPSMSAHNLHPTVWSAASGLWKDGHYGSAVSRAATFLNAEIQDKSTRTDLSDKELMTQVFSPQPASEERPRLRWRGKGTPRTRTSMRDGLLSYAVGVSLAIRNPVAHETAAMDKQVALEQLAALSVLARWVNACHLVTSDEEK